MQPVLRLVEHDRGRRFEHLHGDLFAPVGGRVAEVNQALGDAPERVNTDPYGAGWLLRLEEVDEAGASLLDEAGYGRLTEEAAH